jgi:hypothetical protein
MAGLFSRPRLLRHRVAIRYGFGRDVRNDRLEVWATHPRKNKKTRRFEKTPRLKD